jgi:hypothetical protein
VLIHLGAKEDVVRALHAQHERVVLVAHLRMAPLHAPLAGCVLHGLEQGMHAGMLKARGDGPATGHGMGTHGTAQVSELKLPSVQPPGLMEMYLSQHRLHQLLLL